MMRDSGRKERCRIRAEMKTRIAVRPRFCILGDKKRIREKLQRKVEHQLRYSRNISDKPTTFSLNVCCLYQRGWKGNRYIVGVCEGMGWNCAWMGTTVSPCGCLVSDVSYKGSDVCQKVSRCPSIDYP